MSCVLRVSSDGLGEVLRGLSLKPYRFEKGTAHFQVSECSFSDLTGQIREAASFLRSNQIEIATLMAAPAASGVLDFAVESVSSEFRFANLPSELVREVGALGLAIELSQYPREVGGGDVASS